MFTPATDYNQQLLASLQMLRQLVDQCTAMATAGMAFPTPPFAMPPAPFMAPGAQFIQPPMPPMPPSSASAPPTPPAPADYAQQLFGYLQAWRQYLEQMAGASPGSGSDKPPQAQDGTSAPGNGAGGGTARSESKLGSGPTFPPRLLDLPPTNLGGSQLTATDIRGASPLAPSGQTGPLIGIAPTDFSVSQISGPGFDPGGSFEEGPHEPRVLHHPTNELETFMPPPPPILTRTPVPERPSGVVTPGLLGQHSAGSSFQSAIDRLDPTSVREVAPKSLFSTPEASTPSARLRPASETSSR
jgi:hypothetical protein